MLLTGTISLNINSSTNLENDLDNSSNVIDNELNYSDIKGLYKYKTESLTDEFDNEISASYSLYLYENGTFHYRRSTMAPCGYMGNYIISGNTVVLNYLFSTNSGAGIEVTKGTKTLIINSDNTLTDTNQSITAIKEKSVILTKTSPDEENEFLQSNDFSKILNDCTIRNNLER